MTRQIKATETNKKLNYLFQVLHKTTQDYILNSDLFKTLFQARLTKNAFLVKKKCILLSQM